MRVEPVRRWGVWLTIATVGWLSGCKWCHKVPLPTIRGQAPSSSTDSSELARPLSPAVLPPPLECGNEGPKAAAGKGPSNLSPHSLATSTLKAEQGAEEVMPASLSWPQTAVRLHELLQRATPRIKIVALIGSHTVVTDQEVREAVYQRLAEYRHLPGPLRAAKQQELYAAELRRIIERELLLADMQARLKKAGKLSAMEEIRDYAEKTADRALHQIRKAYGTESDEEFLNILRAQGLTLQIVRRQLIRQIMADEYARTLLKDRVRTPGFAEIRAYYEAHPDEFRTEDQVQWQHIFFSFARHPSEAAARQHAEQVRQLALQGVDFATLVQQHDQGLAAGNGGWGVGHRRGQIQPADLENVVWSLRPGEISEVITTSSGCHLLKVVERKYAGIRPFDGKLQDEIREKLLRHNRESEYSRLIAELWRTGGVQVVASPP
ncbi:MAG: peptidylprolyl isomerase [Gemmataceae bacterium]|nr:peptidylprolyl isomerase [Gemmataceae bacterium]